MMAWMESKYMPISTSPNITTSTTTTTPPTDLRCVIISEQHGQHTGSEGELFREWGHHVVPETGGHRSGVGSGRGGDHIAGLPPGLQELPILKMLLNYQQNKNTKYIASYRYFF